MLKMSDAVEYRLFLLALFVCIPGGIAASFYFGTPWIFLGSWLVLAVVVTHATNYPFTGWKDFLLEFVENLVMSLFAGLGTILNPEMWIYKKDKNDV